MNLLLPVVWYITNMFWLHHHWYVIGEPIHIFVSFYNHTKFDYTELDIEKGDTKKKTKKNVHV